MAFAEGGGQIIVLKNIVDHYWLTTRSFISFSMFMQLLCLEYLLLEASLRAQGTILLFCNCSKARGTLTTKC